MVHQYQWLHLLDFLHGPNDLELSVHAVLLTVCKSSFHTEGASATSVINTKQIKMIKIFAPKGSGEDMLDSLNWMLQ